MRIKTAFLTCVLVLLSSGCHAPAAQTAPRPAGQATEFTATLRHAGVERTYHIHLPPGFSKNKPAALVLALHGGGGVGRSFDRTTTQGTLTAAGDRRGVVFVFPEGIDRHWCDGRPEICKGKETRGDVGFLSALIDTMVQDYGIDPARVYVTGMSNGGFMTVRLALDLSGKLAAVAPVAAQMAKAVQDRSPRRPISIMLFHGTEDPIVPFRAGHIRLFRFGRSRGEVLSTAETIERFRRFDGCAEEPTVEKLPDKDPHDGTRVQVERTAGCREGTEVVLVKVVGGGHSWPGGKPTLSPRIVGAVSRDINASEMILDFFLAHSR